MKSTLLLALLAIAPLGFAATPPSRWLDEKEIDRLAPAMAGMTYPTTFDEVMALVGPPAVQKNLPVRTTVFTGVPGADERFIARIFSPIPRRRKVAICSWRMAGRCPVARRANAKWRKSNCTT